MDIWFNYMNGLTAYVSLVSFTDFKISDKAIYLSILLLVKK